MSEGESIPFTDLGNDQIMFVLVKSAWTNPGQEAKLDFQIIAAERTTDLVELQQAIQDDFEAHAAEDHPGVIAHNGDFRPLRPFQA